MSAQALRRGERKNTLSVMLRLACWPWLITAMTAEASNAAEADYSNDGDDTDWQPSPMESD